MLPTVALTLPSWPYGTTTRAAADVTEWGIRRGDTLTLAPLDTATTTSVIAVIDGQPVGRVTGIGFHPDRRGLLDQETIDALVRASPYADQVEDSEYDEFAGVCVYTLEDGGTLTVDARTGEMTSTACDQLAG
jgi:hypothetical protein